MLPANKKINRIYDSYFYIPGIGDVVSLKEDDWLFSTNFKLLRRRKDEIFIILDTSDMTSITLLSESGLARAAGICGPCSRANWDDKFNVLFINDECNLNNTNDKIS